MRNKVSCVVLCLAVFLVEQNAYASAESTGPNGIDSFGLALSGDGVGIGQIENFRPGDPWDNSQTEVLPFPAFDTTAARFHPSINPKAVYFATHPMASPNTIDFTATANAASETGSGHATEVAGVIISTDTTPIDMSTDFAIGVAPQADLYSSGFGPTFFPREVFARTAQFIAGRNGGNIAAINISSGINLVGDEQPDGTSTFSSFIDWSARKHDVLYVVAGPYTPDLSGIRIPADNFNGITVAFSKKNGVKFRQADSRNVVIPSTRRTYIDLIAPGFGIVTAVQGNETDIAFGTSLAAPHVTGTVALLQEHANNVGWGANARRHEVMKAVLMNSADKLEDTGDGKLLGMSRTVLDSNGNNWLHASNPAATDTTIPLHEEFGAGHLNAKRALQQFIPGESDPGSVPTIGWDFETTSGVNSETRYEIDTPLQADNYISITLAWDRLVDLTNDDGVYNSGDTFETYNLPGNLPDSLEEQVNDLGIYLVERGEDFTTALATGAVSDGFVEGGGGYNLEHLFYEVPTTGLYDIVIPHFATTLGTPLPPQDYALAWWTGLAPEIQPPNLLGDFDNDNDVDGADFLAWQRNPGVGNLSDWENEYGSIGALAAANTVPEPSSVLLLLVGLGLPFVARRKS